MGPGSSVSYGIRGYFKFMSIQDINISFMEATIHLPHPENHPKSASWAHAFRKALPNELPLAKAIHRQWTRKQIMINRT